MQGPPELLRPNFIARPQSVYIARGALFQKVIKGTMLNDVRAPRKMLRERGQAGAAARRLQRDELEQKDEDRHVGQDVNDEVE